MLADRSRRLLSGVEANHLSNKNSNSYFSIADLPFFNNKFAFDSFNLNRIYHLKLKYEQKK